MFKAQNEFKQATLPSPVFETLNKHWYFIINGKQYRSV